MDSNLLVVEKSSESTAQNLIEAGRSFDTNFVEVMVMENRTSSSVIYMDVKATQDVEVTDISQTSVRSNNDSTISSTRVFPDVQFDSESSKEIEPKESGLSNSSHGKSNTRDVPDVSFDSGSSKESQIKDLYPTEDIIDETNTPNSMEKDINTTKFDLEDTLEKESNKDEEETDRLQDTSLIQDAFIFCPMMESFVLSETMIQEALS